MVRRPDIPTFADLNIKFDEAVRNNPFFKQQVDLIRQNLLQFEGFEVTDDLRKSITEHVEKVAQQGVIYPEVKILGSSVDENNVLMIDVEVPYYMQRPPFHKL